MSIYSILAALVISLIVIFLFARLLQRPFWSLWMVLLIVFIATWAGQIWLNDYGPVTMGISWIALVGVSLFGGLLAVVFMPTRSEKKEKSEHKLESATFMAGVLFWIVMVLLIILVGLGYYFF